MYLYKQYLSGLFESVFKSRQALPTEFVRAQKGYLMSYSLTINYFLNRYTTDNSTDIVNADTWILKPQGLTATN